MGRLIRYRPWLYLANLGMWTLIVTAELLPGLLAKLYRSAIAMLIGRLEEWKVGRLAKVNQSSNLPRKGVSVVFPKFAPGLKCFPLTGVIGIFTHLELR
jgi:hypothetical protein